LAHKFQYDLNLKRGELDKVLIKLKTIWICLNGNTLHNLIVGIRTIQYDKYFITDALEKVWINLRTILDIFKY